MLVRARAPLRLGLAGGGTDVSPFCDLHGGYVLNATIDKYAYATIQLNDSPTVTFVAADQGQSTTYPASANLPVDGTLDLHKGVYNRIIRVFNNSVPLPLTVTTFIDVPAGSGLGSSSTLVVAMVKAYVELLNLPLGEYEIAQLAFEIERVDIGLNGGRQDQYAATFGGFNFMEFYANNRVIVNPLRVKNWIVSELEASLLLFYTGVSRESARIIDEQAKNIKEGQTAALDAMAELKVDAQGMKEALLRGQLGKFAEYMGRSWQAKKRTAKNISTPHIEEIYEGAMRAGASAGKVSGAGGGGFMMFMADPVKRMKVLRFLQTMNGEAITCHFTERGTQGWRID
jgi:D-glycero-alpha-D-manno-heptose-7-phosphate kinase